MNNTALEETILTEFNNILNKHNPNHDITLKICMSMMIKIFVDTNLSTIHREAIYQTMNNITKHLTELHESTR